MLDKEELHFLDRRSDGFLFVVPSGRNRLFEILVQHQMPVVACFVDDVPSGVHSVVLDNAGAMRQSVEHLVAQGHRRIAHFNGPIERADFRARREGYDAAMRAAGLEAHTLCIEAGYMETDVVTPAERLMDLVQSGQVTAVACATDLGALQLLDLAEARGLSVPADLSLVGMDDLPDAIERRLTTLRFSSEGLGRLAADTLVQLLAGEGAPAPTQFVPVELIERDSVAPPR